MSYAGQITVLMIMLFSVLIVPAVLAVGLYRWYQERQKNKQFSLELLKISTLKNYAYKHTDSRANMLFSSYNTGKLTDVLSGNLPHSGNKFFIARQEELRGTLNSVDVTLRRSVMSVDIPDTQLQLIIISKAKMSILSGGNLQLVKGSQRIKLEGDFGEFFDIFMPHITQSETLSMLTPDSMLYILMNFASYDIEINTNKLFVYNYDFMPIEKIEQLLIHMDRLLNEMRLMENDSRREKATNALVARTATDSSTEVRALHRSVKTNIVVVFLILLSLSFLPHQLQILNFPVIFFIYRRTIIQTYRELRLRRRYKQVIKAL